LKKVVGVEGKRAESLKHGAKRTIYVPVIPAGDFIQYTPDHEKLRSLIETYGYFNNFAVMNNDVVDIEIRLDYSIYKSYPVPYSSSIAVDEVEFMGFNIHNTHETNATNLNKIMVIIGYERSLLREAD
jgi:hypothetical protein